MTGKEGGTSKGDLDSNKMELGDEVTSCGCRRENEGPLPTVGAVRGRENEGPLSTVEAVRGSWYQGQDARYRFKDGRGGLK